MTRLVNVSSQSLYRASIQFRSMEKVQWKHSHTYSVHRIEYIAFHRENYTFFCLHYEQGAWVRAHVYRTHKFQERGENWDFIASHSFSSPSALFKYFFSRGRRKERGRSKDPTSRARTQDEIDFPPCIYVQTFISLIFMLSNGRLRNDHSEKDLPAKRENGRIARFVVMMQCIVVCILKKINLYVHTSFLF